MASERWVPIYSRLFDPDHELAGDDPVCQRWAWADICFMAQYKDGTRIFSGKVVTLRRGEFLASLRFLEKRWRWSKNRVARFLKALEKVDKIRPVETHRSGTVFTVVRYEEYCPSRDSDEPTHGPGHGPTREPRDGDATGTDVGQITEGTEGATSTTGVDWPAVPAATTKRGGGVRRSMPEGWEPSDGHKEEARKLGIDVKWEADKFRDYVKSQGKKYIDWEAAFRNWIRGSVEKGSRPLSLLPEERIPDGEGGYRITRR